MKTDGRILRLQALLERVKVNAARPRLPGEHAGERSQSRAQGLPVPPERSGAARALDAEVTDQEEGRISDLPMVLQMPSVDLTELPAVLGVLDAAVDGAGSEGPALRPSEFHGVDDVSDEPGAELSISVESYDGPDIEMLDEDIFDDEFADERAAMEPTPDTQDAATPASVRSVWEEVARHDDEQAQHGASGAVSEPPASAVLDTAPGDLRLPGAFDVGLDAELLAGESVFEESPLTPPPESGPGPIHVADWPLPPRERPSMEQLGETIELEEETHVRLELGSVSADDAGSMREELAAKVPDDLEAPDLGLCRSPLPPGVEPARFSARVARRTTAFVALLDASLGLSPR